MYVYMTHIRAYTSVDILQYMLNYTYIYCYAGSQMIARNVGQAIGNVRNIGSTVNAMSGGRIDASRFGQKMQEITNKVESGANFIANNEDKAQGFKGDISRKVNA